MGKHKNASKKAANDLIKKYGLFSIPYRELLAVPAGAVKLLNDEVWKRHILRRDNSSCRLAGLDTIRCTAVIQAMHIITRGNYRLRHDPLNGMAGCTGHHKYYTHNEYKFHDLIRRRFPDVWDILYLLSSKQSKKPSHEHVYLWLCNQHRILITNNTDGGRDEKKEKR
jgi:hypothetical protein